MVSSVWSRLWFVAWRLRFLDGQYRYAMQCWRLQVLHVWSELTVSTIVIFVASSEPHDRFHPARNDECEYLTYVLITSSLSAREPELYIAI